MTAKSKPRGLFLLYTALTIAVVVASLYLLHIQSVSGLGESERGVDEEAFISITFPAVLLILPVVVAGLRIIWQFHFSSKELDRSRFEGMRVISTILREFMYILFALCIYMVGLATLFSGTYVICLFFIAISITSSLKAANGLEFFVYKMRGMV